MLFVICFNNGIISVIIMTPNMKCVSRRLLGNVSLKICCKLKRAKVISSSFSTCNGLSLVMSRERPLHRDMNNRIRYSTILTDYCIASNLKLLTTKFDSSVCKSDTNIVFRCSCNGKTRPYET